MHIHWTQKVHFRWEYFWIDIKWCLKNYVVALLIEWHEEIDEWRVTSKEVKKTWDPQIFHIWEVPRHLVSISRYFYRIIAIFQKIMTFLVQLVKLANQCLNWNESYLLILYQNRTELSEFSKSSEIPNPIGEIIIINSYLVRFIQKIKKKQLVSLVLTMKITDFVWKVAKIGTYHLKQNEKCCFLSKKVQNFGRLFE